MGALMNRSSDVRFLPGPGGALTESGFMRIVEGVDSQHHRAAASEPKLSGPHVYGR